jgi:hypothetical protein
MSWQPHGITMHQRIMEDITMTYKKAELNKTGAYGHDGHDAAHLPTRPTGWHDASWRNDVSPSYGAKLERGYAQIFFPYPPGHEDHEEGYKEGCVILAAYDDDGQPVVIDGVDVNVQYPDFATGIAAAHKVLGELKEAQ